MAKVSLSFGKELQRYRDQAGLTQEELGEKLGISRAAVSQMERGVIGASPQTLARIERVLGLGQQYANELLHGLKSSDRPDHLALLQEIAALPKHEDRVAALRSLSPDLQQVLVKLAQDILLDTALQLRGAFVQADQLPQAKEDASSLDGSP